MFIFAVWIILGLIAGMVARRLFYHPGGLVLDLVLGMIGALAGGLAIQSLGFSQPFDSMVVGTVAAAAGATGMLAGFRAIFREA